MGWFRWEGPDLILELLVQPRASTNTFAGIVGDRLKVRTTAPPVEGEANVRLVAWLARQFDVPRASVTLCHGATGRRKRVRISAPGEIPQELPIAR